MNYVLDTNILLLYLRDPLTKAQIEQQFDPFAATNNPIISVVSVGEIRSIALQNQWGGKRLTAVEALLQKAIITDIKYEPILQKYAEIDAFSQGRLMAQPLGSSARNMGKNDLWIAATAAVANAQLLTTDRDFDHLNGIFLTVLTIERVKS